MTTPHQPTDRRSFTWSELLVVVAIIALLAALWLPAVLLTATALGAAEPKNLLHNGGFENSIAVAITSSNENYRPLLERKVALPVGDSVSMPAKTHLNPADGWLGEGNRFECVTGAAGKEVHTGTRAVRIESPVVSSAIALGDSISVVEGIGLNERAVAVGKPIKFSFWAKGKGMVRVNCYMYGLKHDNLYDYAKLRTVTPEQFAVDDDTKWQRFAGTLEIKDATVNYFIFVIAVHGQATLDDIVLEAQ